MFIGIRLAYDGSKYSGFQKQMNAATVQGEIEKVIEKVEKKKIKTVGASRTDAGVHALDNFIMFESYSGIEPKRWIKILNSHLKDIVTTDAYEVDENFHPLRDKGIKTYEYNIINGEINDPLQAEKLYHIKQKLDIDLMKSAAKLFIGEHDFSAFKSGNKEYKTTVRNIFISKISVKKSKVFIGSNYIKFTVSGDGFMYNMVRIMIGTLIDLGLHKISIEQFNEVLNNQNTKFRGATAPPNALVLKRIDFKGKEKMRKKDTHYIFFDIDGTIYDSKIGITEDAVYTIKKLKENGHKVFICTGRSKAGIDEEILDLGFDGIVAACGLYVEIGGKVIKNVHLPKETLDWVIKNIAMNDGLSVILEGSENIYLDANKQTEDEKKRYSKFIEANKKRILDFKSSILNINKFGVRMTKYSDVDSLIREIMDKNLNIVLHTSMTYEVVPNGYDKAVGMRDVIQYFGANLDKTVACGDSTNDLEMLKEAELSIVPENGMDNAKELADYVTDDIMNDGLKKAFEYYGFI